MAQRVFYRDGDSSKLTSNGTFLAKNLTAEYGDSVCAICAYDANGGVVTPTAGTATFSMAPLDGQFHDADIFSINLTLAGETATYDLPRVFGPVVESKVEISGVDFVGDGIDHIIAYIWRG